MSLMCVGKEGGQRAYTKLHDCMRKGLKSSLSLVSIAHVENSQIGKVLTLKPLRYLSPQDSISSVARYSLYIYI